MSAKLYFPELAGAFERLLKAAAGRKIAVVGHARPDGDCIGSQVALSRMLAAQGLDVVCVNSDRVPRRLQFLAGGTTFLRPEQLVKQSEERAAIFVDCADQARGGERLKGFFPKPLGNIDHHLSNPNYAEINLVDSGAAATCEILAGVFLDKGLSPDAGAAQALYAGILTDTGQFRFPSTSRRCFLLASELLARGADPAVAAFELYERESSGKLQLLQRFLASLRLECGGRVCVGTLSEADYSATETSPEDTEGLVDYARAIDRVDVGVLIEERPNGSVKASLRCKDPKLRLDLVAAQFGGGGHACAAGLNCKPAPPDFRNRLLEALGRRLDEVAAAKK